MKDSIKKPSTLRRLLQIIMGVLLLPICLFFIIVSIIFIFSSLDTATSIIEILLVTILGNIILLGSFLFTNLTFRLILNKQHTTTLDERLPPRALMLMALYFIAIPIISIFTGAFFENPLRNILLAPVFFLAAVGTFRLARKKSSQMMYIKHEYLTAKIYSFGTRIIFFEEGKYIAEYDGVYQVLSFKDEESFLFNVSSPERVKDTVFPKGTAEISCIVDLDEIEGEVLAHLERTFLGHSEVIICSKREYTVVRTQKLLSGVAELYENNHSIATITTGLFRQKSIFRNDLPLKDRIFISLLVYMNWPPHT